MKREIVVPVLVALCLAASAASAAKPKPMSVDRSSGVLIDPAGAEVIWEQTMPAKVFRIYPKRRFRFVGEVNGGFTESKTCVVTARAMVLPVQGTRILYAPIKSATTFDAVPSLSNAQCQELARGKLKEAIEAIAASIMRT